MKLRRPVRHPDQLIRLRLPGEVAYLLERYRVYQTDTTHVEWEPHDLITEILRSFLEEGDREFLAWRKTHDPDTSPPPVRAGNGRALPQRVTQE